MLFDGNDDYGFSVSVPEFDFPTGFTLEAWTKADNTQISPDRGIVAKWNGGLGYMMWMDEGGRINLPIDGNIRDAVGGDLRDNSWHHIATIWNGTSRIFYIDGVLVGSDPLSGAPTHITGDLLVGNYGVGHDRGFHGKIDEVKIYNRPITSEEVLSDRGVIFILTPTITVTPTPTSTQVVLNEFMPFPTNNQDWVEIFNAGGTDVDISGWKLADTTGIFKTFVGGTFLSTGGFKTVIQSSRLNNGGDTIFLRDSSNTTIDSKSYTSGEVIENHSIGRNPDGGSWQPCLTPSQNSTNNGSC